MNHCLQNGIPLWNNETNYKIGAAVQFNGNWYRAIKDNQNKQPDISVDDWIGFAGKLNFVSLGNSFTNYFHTSLDISKYDDSFISLFYNPGFQNPPDSPMTLITENVKPGFYCEMSIFNVIGNENNFNYSSIKISDSNKTIFLNAKLVGADITLNLANTNFGNVIKIYCAYLPEFDPEGVCLFIYSNFAVTVNDSINDTKKGLISYNDVYTISQKVISQYDTQKFNEEHPVGSTIIKADGILPPKQNIGGVNWQVVFAGDYALVASNQSVAGNVHDAGNSIAAGNTGGHSLTADENGTHQHITPWGENPEDYSPPWGIWSDGGSNRRGSADSDTDNVWGLTSPEGTGSPHSHPTSYNTLYVVVWKRIS